MMGIGVVSGRDRRGECERGGELTMTTLRRTGSIDANELGNALRAFGYNLSPKLIHIVSQKYSECRR